MPFARLIIIVPSSFENFPSKDEDICDPLEMLYLQLWFYFSCKEVVKVGFCSFNKQTVLQKTTEIPFLKNTNTKKLGTFLLIKRKKQSCQTYAIITCRFPILPTSRKMFAASLYLVHGVQQLGELVESLPVLAGVLLALHDGFPQLLNVRHADLLKHCLTLQAILRHCVWGGNAQYQQLSLWIEPWHLGNQLQREGLTCAEQQQDLHAQVLVVGNLQPDELAGNLHHLLKLLGHVGQLHPLPAGANQHSVRDLLHLYNRLQVNTHSLNTRRGNGQQTEKDLKLKIHACLFFLLLDL